MMKTTTFAAVLATAAATGLTAEQSHDINRMKLIQEINTKPNTMWTAGENSRFKGTDTHSHSSLCGVKHDSKYKLASKGLKIMKADPSFKAPSDFDSATNWPQCSKVISDIRDQSMCGCCWAFAGASAASDRLCIATNGSVAVPLSAQETCFCASDNGCNGGYVDAPWDYISQVGVATGGQFNGTGTMGGGFCSAFSLPHCHHHGPQGNDPYPAEGTAGCPEQHSPQCPQKCDAGASSDHSNFDTDRYTFDGSVVGFDSVSAIEQAIMEQGPVEAAFTVYEDFANYVSGIYHHVTGTMEGGHAIRIVGWGEENGQAYWKIANSWNPYWGENGYFRIKKGSNECGIEDQVVASSPDAKWHKGSR